MNKQELKTIEQAAENRIKMLRDNSRNPKKRIEDIETMLKGMRFYMKKILKGEDPHGEFARCLERIRERLRKKHNI